MTDETTAFYVYFLRCADNSYYVGHTQDIAARVDRHNTSKGSFWAVQRLPVTVVHHECFKNENAAMKRERQLKGWSRKKKEALIKGDLAALKAAGRK